MASDWLLGPAQVDTNGLILTRSLVLDIEVVETVYGMLLNLVAEQDRVWESEVAATSAAAGLALGEGAPARPRPSDIYPVSLRLHDFEALGVGRAISIETAREQLPADRARMGLEGGGVSILFRQGQQPCVQIPAWADGTDTDGMRAAAVGREIAAFLLRNGRPRLRLYNWRAYLPAVGGAGALLAWVWMVSTEPPALSVGVFTALLAVLAFLGSLTWTAARLRANRSSHPGIRFREASRADARAQLARVKASAVVTLVAGPLGAAVTLGIQALVGAGPFAGR